jgi:hypothetical protein
VLLVAVVIGGGYWVSHELNDAKAERCQLAFGQIHLLQVELLALQDQVVALPAADRATLKATIDQGVSEVTSVCGPVPA